MLVLSRRLNDKILFPKLGITIEILRVEGRAVRVGIDAPRDIEIRRHELEPRSTNEAEAEAKRNKLVDQIRNAAQALNELYSLLDDSAHRDSCEEAMFAMFQQLKALDEEAKFKAVPQIECAHHEQQAAPSDKPRRRALLVEDNVNECRLLASYLRCKDFDVAVAYEGSSALDYLDRNDQPDVVLLDMQMPGVDGPTTVRGIRKRRELEGLKVIAVSGGDPTDYGLELGPTGVDGWFPKPLDPESLAFRLAVGDADKAPA